MLKHCEFQYKFENKWAHLSTFRTMAKLKKYRCERELLNVYCIGDISLLNKDAETLWVSI